MYGIFFLRYQQPIDIILRFKYILFLMIIIF